MTEMTKKLVCKFFNKGYCKFTSKCKFEHPENKCTEESCRNKACRKRHPKQCRYKENCRRQTSCLYNHDDTKKTMKEVENAEVRKLILEVETIKQENKQKLNDIKTLEDEINTLKRNGEDREKVFHDDIKDLKEEIKKLKIQNKEIEALKKANSELRERLSKLEACQNLQTTEAKDTEKSPKQKQNQNKELMNCPFCSQPFSHTELINHIKVTHKKSKKMCSLCNEEFKENHNRSCKYLNRN